MIPAILLPHPAVAVPAGLRISFDCTPNADGSLSLRYRLDGEISALCLPAPVASPGPADGLWQHSCCELFVAEEGDAYREFNFSPSGEWAAYAFSAYRQRLDWQPAAAPQIGCNTSATSIELWVELPAALLPAAPEFHLSATAVIETRDGALSYWALHHAGERPDFHRRESFVLSLPDTPVVGAAIGRESPTPLSRSFAGNARSYKTLPP